MGEKLTCIWTDHLWNKILITTLTLPEKNALPSQILIINLKVKGKKYIQNHKATAENLLAISSSLIYMQAI